ncbi:MAG: MIP family channel protein [Chloroflexi bacterium]|nr:MIP family channel protein [Chloroflexota bacterium]
MRDLSDRDNLRAMAAELIATFMFVFVGVGAIGAFGQLGGIAGPQLLLIALAHGLGISVGVIAVGRISGAHLNPAVTIAALITGNIGLIKSVMYIVAQLGGAALAMVALDGIAYQSANLGLQTVSPSIGTGNGFVLEVILTFFLVFVIFATAIDKRGNAVLAPLAIGGVIALDHFIAFPLTGASMNPARSFGPALIHGIWDDHWVYWAGPVAGAVLAGIAYVVVFGTAEDRRKAGAIPFTESETKPRKRRRDG